MRALFARIDPMIRMLVAALLLAILFPAVGEGRLAADWIAKGAIFLLFFLNGLRLPTGQVIEGLKNWRFQGALALWVFGAMLIAGWLLWQVSALFLPPLLALGFLFLGALPSTVQSATAYTSLAKGNVANAVIAAAILNIAGVFITAPLFAFFAGSEAVPFNTDVLLRVMLILLLPFVIGQVLQPKLGPFVARHAEPAKWMDRIAIALAVYVGMSGAVAEGVGARIDTTGWVWLLFGVCAMLAFATTGSWAVSKGLGFSFKDRIAFLFGGTQKSVAMGAPLATILFDPATAGMILMPLISYHFLQLVLAAPLAARLAKLHD